MRRLRSGGAAGFAGRVRKRTVSLCALACVSAAVLVVGLGLLRVDAEQQATYSLPAINPPGLSAKTPPAADENKQQATTDEPPAESAAGDPQKQGVSQECADLLKMATALKKEVDKTTADTLSVTVVREAGQIEQLAHKVRLGSGKS
jgi:hypothetical protein